MRNLVVGALEDIVCQTIKQLNDDSRTVRLLESRPDLRPHDEGMRLVSEVLGVGRCFLHRLEGGELERAFAAAKFILELREGECTASALAIQRLQEFLRPVTNGHPKMTVSEALTEIKRRTDETVRGLEGEDGV
jgi:hypothetical protein